MPQSRAASSAGVGKKLLLARSIEDCPSHVALTVMHAYFAFFPTVWLLAVYATHHHKALLISNAIEKVHASWHDMRGATHEECVQYRKTLTLLIYLVHTIHPMALLV